MKWILNNFKLNGFMQEDVMRSFLKIELAANKLEVKADDLK